jgi:hypothetical protein
MIFLSLQPFVPSGADFQASKKLFQELGFKITWDAGGYVGFDREGCRFILQEFDNVEFAQNFMVNVRISSAEEFLKEVTEKKLTEKFNVRVSGIMRQLYGKEVNLIDIAGVCWHFVE